MTPGMYRITGDELPVSGKQPIGQVIAPPRRRWYDFLEALVPYRDVVMLLGAGQIVWAVSLPWSGEQRALLVAGAFFIQAARMMGMSAGRR